MTTLSPLLILNNGVQMPALGLGVFQSAPDDTVDAVTAAIADGYRLVDTAAAYGNEKEVGQGIRQSGIDRSEMFVTTKLWVSDYGYDQTLAAFDTSLDKLGLDYLDLYLLHWPLPSAPHLTVGSYKAAEKLLADGRIRAIGVCNHSPENLGSLIAATDTIPAVNQVELHPYFTQQEVREADTRRGVITQSWSPIGGVNVYSASDPATAKNLLADPRINTIAAKYEKTSAQVIIRWHLQHGLSVIPKSVKTARITENFDVFDFALTSDEITAIDNLDTGTRGGPDPQTVDQSTFA